MVNTDVDFAEARRASFVFNAGGGCYLAKDWPLPAHILDLSAEFRNITNGRLVPEGKGLLGALAYYGLDSIGTKHKEEMRKRIMQGRPFTPEEEKKIGLYCLGDARDVVRLLPKMLPHINLRQALYREFEAGALSRRIRRLLGADRPSWPAHRYGHFPVACRRTHLGCDARCDGARRRRPLPSLRAQQFR